MIIILSLHNSKLPWFFNYQKCEEYWPVSVGESIQPGHGLTITLTSTLPFAEYSVKKMTLTCVSCILNLTL